MKILGTSAALFAILLSGCAAKHEMPTANTPFAGDKALSLAGNMELLAGNTTVVNKDKDANAAEMAAAAAVTNRFSPVGRTIKSRSYHDRYYVGSHIEDQILENGKGSVQDATCV